MTAYVKTRLGPLLEHIIITIVYSATAKSLTLTKFVTITNQD